MCPDLSANVAEHASKLQHLSAADVLRKLLGLMVRVACSATVKSLGLTYLKKRELVASATAARLMLIAPSSSAMLGAAEIVTL
jgi:hypothetical protein